ncbi:hypothetical protein GIY56_03260 [Paracoccus sp. YIM 132242]|uniref:Uncharacterized protein n=1 Tax=Paracoccus lichenicola TaxID=2665644 RepID=A0A6L6HM28_9RHOB|nr:hypothetical protein [Paracoccus lichenicola]MTD99300.1 hypothetical protein [Paracoccus lichenicola]
MRPSSGIPALPADLRQQLLAMPLTAGEKSEVARALLKLAPPRENMRKLSQHQEKRPAG